MANIYITGTNRSQDKLCSFETIQLRVKKSSPLQGEVGGVFWKNIQTSPTPPYKGGD
jgi:hypothetical protein